MKVGRRLKIAVVGTMVLALGAGLSFGPLVRAKASTAAARYGASLTIDSVRPRWNGVTLRGVLVKLDDAPSVSVTLDEVLVDGALGSSRVVTARGGELRATGAPEQIAAEIAALRERLAKRAQSGGGATHTALAAEDMRALWQRAEGSTERIEATGLRVSPVEGGGELEAATVSGKVGRAVLLAKGIDLALERAPGGFRARSVTAREAFVDLSAERAPGSRDEPGTAPPVASHEPAGGVAPSAVAFGAGASPAGAALPAGSRDPRDLAKDASKAAAAPGGGAAAPLEGTRPGAEEDIARAVAAARDKGALVLAMLDERLAPETTLVVEQATARVRVRGDVVSIGPGRFELRREEGSPRKLVVEIARVADDGDGGRLTARLSLPLGEGAAASPIKAEMHGGPISLSSLGLREGDFGLLEPDRGSLAADATVELDEAAHLVRFDGEGHLNGLSLQYDALSDQPLRGLDVGFRGTIEAPLDGSALRARKAEIELGALRVTLAGSVTRARGAAGKPDDFQVDARYEVPLVACQSVLDAAPAGLFPVVAGSTMAGSLALKGHAKFDTAQLDKTYDVSWDAAVGCRMVAPRPLAAVERFQKPFKKTIYTPEGSRTEAEFGPGTESWAPRSRISHFMSIAVITSEDGRFERHGGFDHEAIRNSIRENIRARRFVRGASTISMQLAKNLYLPRDKTLSRKLEEAILTLYLEQVLTKDQMMELYLNVVEFGPMVYGIGPAARHYFRTSPEALTVSQSYYLASILPSPKKQHFGPGGAVSGAWLSHLRRLMKYAHHRGRLTDAELDEGLSEVPVFGSPSPVHEAREDGGEGEEGGVRREPWVDADGDG